MTIRAAFLGACLCLFGCTNRAALNAGPPPLATDARGIWETYQQRAPRNIKMRHQVEAAFFGRSQVLEGIFVLQKPDRFWVRAMSPLGNTLFDVRREPPAPLKVENYVEEVSDRRAPFFLAHDIARIYLVECPPTATPKLHADVVEISCALPASGTDDEDSHLLMVLSNGGVIVAKHFYKTGTETVRIFYRDYQNISGTWLARRIQLRHQQLDYHLEIALTDADPAFDTSKVFAARP